MSKSPVTLTVLAAIAAATAIGVLTETAAAAQSAQSAQSVQNAQNAQNARSGAAAELRRLPIQIVPAEIRPSKPPRAATPANKQRAPKGPGSVGAGPAQGGIGTPGQLANLVVIPYYANPNGLPEGFPTHSYCLKKPTGGTPDQIRFWVRNAGGSDSGSFQWTPSFPNAGAAPALVIPNVPAGGQVLVTQGIPNGCYTSNYSGICQFSIHLDDHDEVEEWSEANTYDSYCVSPTS